MVNRMAKGVELETDEDLKDMMDKVNNSLVKYEAGDLILTDDKAPVELLSMKAIDALIKDEVDYYKDVYEEEGIKGVLEDF